MEFLWIRRTTNESNRCEDRIDGECNVRKTNTGDGRPEIGRGDALFGLRLDIHRRARPNLVLGFCLGQVVAGWLDQPWMAVVVNFELMFVDVLRFKEQMPDSDIDEVAAAEELHDCPAEQQRGGEDC